MKGVLDSSFRWGYTIWRDFLSSISSHDRSFPNLYLFKKISPRHSVSGTLTKQIALYTFILKVPGSKLGRVRDFPQVSPGNTTEISLKRSRKIITYHSPPSQFIRRYTTSVVYASVI